MPLRESPPLGHVPFDPPPTGPGSASDPLLSAFWSSWREEKFWACHELLEDSWRSQNDPARKQWLRGLIHGAVAMFQWRRGNAVGACRQARRARLCFEDAPGAPEPLTSDFLAAIEREIAPAQARLSPRQSADLDALTRRWHQRNSAAAR